MNCINHVWSQLWYEKVNFLPNLVFFHSILSYNYTCKLFKFVIFNKMFEWSYMYIFEFYVHSYWFLAKYNVFQSFLVGTRSDRILSTKYFSHFLLVHTRSGRILSTKSTSFLKCRHVCPLNLTKVFSRNLKCLPDS